MERRPVLLGYPEQGGPTLGTFASEGVATVLEGDLLGGDDLPVLLLLHAEGCGHRQNGPFRVIS